MLKLFGLTGENVEQTIICGTAESKYPCCLEENVQKICKEMLIGVLKSLFDRTDIKTASESSTVVDIKAY